MDKALPAILNWTYPNDSEESIRPPLPKPTQTSSEHPKFDYDKLVMKACADHSTILSPKHATPRHLMSDEPDLVSIPKTAEV